MKKKISFIILFLVLFSFIFLIGFLIGYKIGKTPAFNISPENVDEVCYELFYGRRPGEVTITQGIIEDWQDNILTIKIAKDKALPLNFLLPETLKIEVSPETEIVFKKLKPKEVHQREVEEYQKLPEKEKEKQPYPSFFFEERASINDIKIGEEVIVHSIENMMNKHKIKASKIEIIAYRKK